jgi:guanosine-3',5'-bis(diphosphate) 3'-pyrophosphohydrolase
MDTAQNTTPGTGVERELVEAAIERIARRLGSYLPEIDLRRLHEAFRIAAEVHCGQKRESGDPTITHPIACAVILTDLEMGFASVVAGILHDTIEDAPDEDKERVKDEIGRGPGPEILSLVEGVTNLSHARFHPEPGAPLEEEVEDRTPKRQRREEDLKKVLLAMARDFRVIVIKFADRLHNMQTLAYLSPDRQIANAQETLRVYAPLAHRLGVWEIKWRLEDLAFKYLYPDEFEEIARKVNKTREERESELAEVQSILASALNDVGIEAEIQGRPKHLWSIYQKMLREEIDFGDIYDLTAVRIVVNTVPECYTALGVVNRLWVPIPGRFSDYIAHRKSNMYQSLHTKVIGPSREPVEIQIRTRDMHRTADFGIAAHWQYKEGGVVDEDFEKRLGWLRQQIFEWEGEGADAGEFLRSAMSELFADQVFVFTPKGDVIDLPVGSTPIDFAYRIHTDLGSKCVAAKVNGQIVPLRYEFDPKLGPDVQKPQFVNGDVVEIIARSNARPSADWLKLAKTSGARSKIRQWLRRQRREEEVARGREALESALKEHGYELRDLERDGAIEPLAEMLVSGEEEDLYASIGAGHTSAQTVVTRLRHRLEPAPEEGLSVGERKGEEKVELRAGGVDNVVYRRSKCCLPIPGDDIVGYVTRGKGMALHRVSCPNVVSLSKRDPDRFVAIDWREEGGLTFGSEIVIEATDRVGLLGDISAVFAAREINISSAKIESQRGRSSRFRLVVDVSGVSQLTELMNAIGRMAEAIRVYRLGKMAAAPRKDGAEH